MKAMTRSVQDFYLKSVTNLQVINGCAELPSSPDLQRKNIEDNAVPLQECISK
jgi:hypothetical protein